MGVHGLWDLLSPVGRRVSVETLAGKRLAIDASIWMVQFMKAMRDERGEMVRNAHILGFFRRICKLLFLRTKPVFVFDGATPALKRRTVIARRRQRENAQAKIRKTAEKLLLNHIKAMRLKELANELEKQRKSNHADKGKKVITDEMTNAVENAKDTNSSPAKDIDQVALDAMLAASIEAEEGGGLVGEASTSGADILPDVEDENDEDDDEEEEMILPTLQGKVDPAVLASLPPSMQLDLLVQMRERLMAENRQKYQKVKKAPARFSEMQIEAYLKTVAFRREINEVQKAAGGRGVDGVQTSRIASEANREFIFSSSYTGKRQSLESDLVEKNSNVQSQVATKSNKGFLSSKKSNNSAIEAFLNEPRKTLNEDIETYRDERGRVRVSKMKAMGIQMTRDLQRNLDLMKEMEQDKIEPSSNSSSFSIKLPESSKEANEESVPVSGTLIEVSFDEDNEHQSVDSDDDVFANIVSGDSLLPEKQATIDSDESEVEWEEGPSDNHVLSSEHAVEHLEAVSKGELMEEADFQEAIRRSMNDIDVSYAPDKFKDDKKMDIETSSASDHPNFEGETGDVDMVNPNITLSECEKDKGICNEPKGEIPFSVHSINDEDEVEWEDGPSDNPESSSAHEVGHMKVVSEGVLMEDADVQGAIGQSMDNFRCHKENDTSFVPQEFKDDKNMDIETSSASRLSLANNSQVDVDEAKINLAKNDPNSMDMQMETSDLSDKNYHHDTSMKAASDDRNSQEETGHVDMVIPTKKRETQIGNLPDVGMRDVTLDDSKQHEDKVTERVPETLESNGTGNESKLDFDVVHNVIEEKDSNLTFEQRKDDVSRFVFNDMSEEQVEITKAGLEEEMTNLSKERTDLGDEQRRLERNAESVSGEMFSECQELLQMFGLPYIIAPMEAEAQCALMELENLVDGVVTDDSDVLLFGARTVYKNIFDDRKYVETYFMKDIESELGLTREKLIRMAMLLGSDYTEGISGIGIVNAVEVINAFPEEDGLHKFREWIESPDPNILGPVGAKEKSRSRKKGSNTSAEEASTLDDDKYRMKQIFMDKHRNVSKNWHIPSTFPSEAVVSAYASPQVDKSTEPFSWGKPDLFVLRKLCAEKFGWGVQKADELLQPVLKEYNKHETQLRLEAFYTFNERFAKIRSKRMSKAVKGIAGSKSSELLDHDEKRPSSGKKKKEIKNESTANENLESLTHEVHTKNTKRASIDRGRGRGRSVGDRRRKNKNILELSSTSSDSDDVAGVHPEHTQGVRKSKRVRKPVIYSEPTTHEDAEVAGSEEEPIEQEETFVTSAAISVEDEDEADKADLDHDTCQKDQDSSQADLEYLKMGGGFCLDEDEGEKEPGLSGFSPLTESAAHEGEVEESISPDGLADLAVTGLQRINEEDDDGIRPVSFLSAMPNLKRKRKNV